MERFPINVVSNTNEHNQMLSLKEEIEMRPILVRLYKSINSYRLSSNLPELYEDHAIVELLNSNSFENV